MKVGSAQSFVIFEKNLILARFLKGVYFRKFYYCEKVFSKCVKGSFISFFKFFMPESKKKSFVFRKNRFKFYLILLKIYNL